MNQKQWAIDQLNKYGEVSRNGALQNRITRLGAIICDLNQNGWEIVGEWVKHDKGKDYVYFLKGKPKKKQVEIINGKAYVVYK